MAEVNGSDHEEALHGLFSMVASDNAEVIPQEAPRGPEAMWSVAANAEEDLYGDTVPTDRSGGSNGTHTDTGHADDDDPDGPTPPPFNGWDEPEAEPGSTWDTASSPFRRAPADSTGSIFSAEPVDHVDDVVDEAELVDDGLWGAQAAAPEGSLFSNGSHLSHAADGRRRPTPGDPRDPRGPLSDDPWVITDRRWDDSGVDWWDQAARTAPTGPTSGAAWADPHQGGPEPVELDDPQGYETAILRLHPQDRERAHVPLSVCGALLHEDELVLGVVTGQMLGRPAAVVVTEARVLVVNDRRWQPVVDIFPIDGDLVVRGRHDRHVAALSFADPTRVSMVDGISEVLIAIELAGHIRDVGERDAD